MKKTKWYLILLFLVSVNSVFAAAISTYPTKTTPVAADKFLISDSADSWKTKNVTLDALIIVGNSGYTFTLGSLDDLKVTLTSEATSNLVDDAIAYGATDDNLRVWSAEHVGLLTTNTQTGSHASPSTTTPLSPTWSGPVHTVWYGATGTINLPAASTYSGRGIRIYNTGAFTITIDPNGSEVIVRDDGTVQTGGVSMTLASGAGNRVALISDGARWVVVGNRGTLAAGS